MDLPLPQAERYADTLREQQKREAEKAQEQAQLERPDRSPN